MKDLFLSAPRMHDIFNLFIWVKQSFQGGKPTRRDKAELCLAPTPPPPTLFAAGPACACSNLFGCHCFCLRQPNRGGASTGALGWCIIFCLLFVLLFIDRLIVTLDMSVVMEDLGTKTQVAAPRHRRTSQTGELIKHDQYFPLPLYPFIYSILSHGLYSCGSKKNSLLSKVQRRSSCLTQYHNNWKPFFSLPLYRHSRSALRMSEYVIRRTIQTLWLIEEEKKLVHLAHFMSEERKGQSLIE